MNIEDQVVSLELAKKLKEIGVEQESLFYWASGSLLFFEEVDWSDADTYSAFTVAELMEKLPSFVRKPGYYSYSKEYHLRIERTRNRYYETNWMVCYCDVDIYEGYEYNELIGITGKKLANVLAKVLVWLIEKGYVEVNDDC